MLYLILVLFMFVGGALTVLTIENFGIRVHLSFLLWQTPALPLGLLIFAAFLLGAVLLYGVSALSAWRDQHEMRRLRERIAELEQREAVTSAAIPPMGMNPVMPLQQVVPRGMNSPISSQPTAPMNAKGSISSQLTAPMNMNPSNTSQGGAPMMRMPGMSGPLPN